MIELSYHHVSKGLDSFAGGRTHAAVLDHIRLGPDRDACSPIVLELEIRNARARFYDE